MKQPRRIPDELPPPLVAVLSPDAAEYGVLGKRQRALLAEVAGTEELLWVAKTGTMTDTGSWFGKRRVCLAMSGKALLLFATGPRPLRQRILLEALKGSRYNVVTGELVLAPEAEPTVRKLALPPVEAARVLAQIGRG
jgi:hypothetical protein